MAFSAVFSPKLIKSTFPIIGSKDSAGAFSKIKYDLIVVPNLRVGPLSKSEVKIARASSKGRGVKNLLGMNFFKDNAFRFLFDIGEMHVVNEPRNLEQVSLFDLFLDENFHPYVAMSWQGEIRAKGVWDTGAEITVFDLGFIKKHLKLFNRVGNSMGTVLKML